MSPTKKACPICGKPTQQAYKPFCSPRCADADLGHWLTESYRVPGAETVPVAGTGSADDEDLS
jgi:endogenous inhibitor of DNA gyrase (YacG/DUF329 family)